MDSKITELNGKHTIYKSEGDYFLFNSFNNMRESNYKLETKIYKNYYLANSMNILYKNDGSIYTNNYSLLTLDSSMKYNKIKAEDYIFIENYGLNKVIKKGSSTEIQFIYNGDIEIKILQGINYHPEIRSSHGSIVVDADIIRIYKEDFPFLKEKYIDIKLNEYIFDDKGKLYQFKDANALPQGCRSAFIKNIPDIAYALLLEHGGTDLGPQDECSLHTSPASTEVEKLNAVKSQLNNDLDIKLSDCF